MDKFWEDLNDNGAAARNDDDDLFPVPAGRRSSLHKFPPNASKQTSGIWIGQLDERGGRGTCRSEPTRSASCGLAGAMEQRNLQVRRSQGERDRWLDLLVAATPPPPRGSAPPRDAAPLRQPREAAVGLAGSPACGPRRSYRPPPPARRRGRLDIGTGGRERAGCGRTCYYGVL